MFKTPSCITLNGMSQSGKTTFLYKLLRRRDELFSPPPTKILFAYGAWQEIFHHMEKTLPIEFVEGLPTKEKLDEFAETGVSKLIVLDDLMDRVICSSDMQNLYSRGCHHSNITVVFISQNIFAQGKASRSIALNTQYMVLFKNP